MRAARAAPTALPAAAAADLADIKRQLAASKRQQECHQQVAAAYKARLTETSKSFKIAMVVCIFALYSTAICPFLLTALGAEFGTCVVTTLPMMVWMYWKEMLQLATKAMMWVIKQLIRWLGPKAWLLVAMLVVILLELGRWFLDTTLARLLASGIVFSGFQCFIIEWLMKAPKKVGTLRVLCF